MERNTQQRITLKLKEYAEEPLTYARKLIHTKIGTYRFRIGDYRVIFDIEDEYLVILRIGHRSSIYK
ncbi:MAG: type II toxin-antitoxin system RelE/ParE family toxin [Methanomicrobia archaeon]|nr:type II toxin-antitoxin system RelE/ParE family toxin [Methanomicrobia archaeon]